MELLTVGVPDTVQTTGDEKSNAKLEGSIWEFVAVGEPKVLRDRSHNTAVARLWD